MMNRGMAASSAVCCVLKSPLIVGFFSSFSTRSSTLLHGLLHFPSPNTKLVDEVGLACLPALTKLSIRKRTGYAMQPAQAMLLIRREAQTTEVHYHKPGNLL
jgi:hypothetical protein